MTAMLPAHLTESVNNLGTAAAALTEEIQADREQRAAENAALVVRQRRQNQRIMALLVVVAMLVAGLLLMALGNRRLNAQNADIVQRIESCTTAGGACYEQSRKRTDSIAGQLLRSELYLDLCLRDNPGHVEAAQVEACVTDRMQADAAERDEPPPSGLGPDGKPVPTPTPTS